MNGSASSRLAPMPLNINSGGRDDEPWRMPVRKQLAIDIENLDFHRADIVARLGFGGHIALDPALGRTSRPLGNLSWSQRRDTPISPWGEMSGRTRGR